MIYKRYIINDEIIFNINESWLQSVGQDGEKVSINAPTARCLQLLIESEGKVISRDEFLESVWKTRGIVVSQNTFYQNISLLRKSMARAGLSRDIVVTVRQRGFVLSPDAHIMPCVDDGGENLDIHMNGLVSHPSKPDSEMLANNIAANSKHNLLINDKTNEEIKRTRPKSIVIMTWMLVITAIMTVTNVATLFL